MSVVSRKSVIPLRHVISIREWFILNIDHNRKLCAYRKVYEALKNNPSKEDWIEHLKGDVQDKNINENVAKEMTKLRYKKISKKKIRQKLFGNLKTVQQSHSNVKDMIYNTF